MKLILCNGKLEILVIWVNRQKDNMQMTQNNCEKNLSKNLKKQEIYFLNVECLHLQDHAISLQIVWFKRQKCIKN